MKFLSHQLTFPDVSESSEDGLLAVGGDLSSERLLLAYSKGIFPWFGEGDPILWWSPDPRFVLLPKNLKVSKSMKQIMKKQKFSFTTNKAFEAVVKHCSTINREKQGQFDTWITDDIITAYTNLHQLGYAISVEVWENNDLVGGLYGLNLKNGVFSGESMFSKVSNASKAGFIYLIQNNNFKLIDCQIRTKHLESLGGAYISRAKFLSYL